MNVLGISYSVALPWIAFAAYRLVSALRIGRSQRKEAIGSRLAFLTVQVLAFTLMFAKWMRIGPLGKRFVPDSGGAKNVGILLIAIGLALAVWGRHHLGQYWSARIGIKGGHKLVCSGPYAYVRHPIYSGIVIALIGTALAIGEWGCVVAACVMLVAFASKAKREEALLAEHFGKAFLEYRKHTGFLIPRFR